MATRRRTTDTSPDEATTEDATEAADPTAAADAAPAAGSAPAAAPTPADPPTPAPTPGPAAAPLEPPAAGTRTPLVPPNNVPAHATAAAPIVHNAEAEHIEIVDEHGQPVAPGAMFTAPEGAQTVVYATRRLFRVYRARNERGTRKALLYAKGARVNLAEVTRIHSAMAAAAAGAPATSIADPATVVNG